MKYTGSKRTVASYLLPRILAGRRAGQWYIEPFCGGCNMLDKVTGLRWGNDNNYLLICMWKALQKGWIPPNVVTEQEYYEIKNNQLAYPPELVCFVGHVCSFGGKWWAGYARDKGGRNYAKEGYNNLMKQRSLIQDIKFTCMDYRQLDLPARSIIYCDPPYQYTLGYNRNFYHPRFWRWARNMAKAGHKVYVSEYNAPEDFICVREIHRTVTMDKSSRKRSIEKLFMYAG